MNTTAAAPWPTRERREQAARTRRRTWLATIVAALLVAAVAVVAVLSVLAPPAPVAPVAPVVSTPVFEQGPPNYPGHVRIDPPVKAKPAPVKVKPAPKPAPKPAAKPAPKGYVDSPARTRAEAKLRAQGYTAAEASIMWACEHGTAWPSQCDGVPSTGAPAVSTAGTEASNAWMAKERARYQAECKRNPAGCPLGPNYLP